jgi:hypothetical protein
MILIIGEGCPGYKIVFVLGKLPLVPGKLGILGEGGVVNHILPSCMKGLFA